MSVQIPSSPILYAVHGGGLLPLPVPEGASDVHALFDHLPLGIYEALRTYSHDRFLGLAEHLARARSSIQRAGLELELDEEALRRALQRAVQDAPFADSRVRIDCLAAPAHEQLGTDSRVLIALSAFTPPAPEVLERGVAVAITRDLTRRDPEVKAAAWVLERRPLPLDTLESYEHLLVDPQGRLLEGTSSNLFCVRNHVLYTAPGGVLAGITRGLVLELAHQQLLSVRLVAIHEEELGSVNEVFLTSSSRHLIPVTRVEDQVIGDGHPGALTRRLAAAFELFARERARPAYPWNVSAADR